MLISDAATVEEDSQEDKVIMINDVARAFFEAPVSREMCVELPAEAKTEGEGDMVALLKKSLYGTRDAAINFQKEVAKVMRRIGFRVGKYNSGMFYHPGRRLRTFVSRRRLRDVRPAGAG